MDGDHQLRLGLERHCSVPPTGHDQLVNDAYKPRHGWMPLVEGRANRRTDSDSTFRLNYNNNNNSNINDNINKRSMSNSVNDSHFQVDTVVRATYKASSCHPPLQLTFLLLLILEKVLNLSENVL